MLRSKWFWFDGARSQRALVAALRESPFDAKEGRGFELMVRNNEVVRCRFTERIESRETVTDPFGNTAEYETIRYNSTTFLLHQCVNSNYGYLLEVLLPPRTIKPIVDALDLALGGASAKEVDLALLDVFYLARRKSSAARISRIKASSLRLTNASEARIDLTSYGDAHQDFVTAFGTAGATIDKIRIDRPFKGVSGALELSRSGLTAYDEDQDDAVRSLMLEYLKP